MGLLSTLFLARSVDHTVSRQTSVRGPITSEGVALAIGCVVGVVFFIGSAWLLSVLGVGQLHAFLFFGLILLSIFVALLVTGWLGSSTVNRSFDDETH